MEEKQVESWVERFDFQANGMTFDLRMTSVYMEEWQIWQEELMKIATAIISEMCLTQTQLKVQEHPQVFMDSELMGKEMLFRYCAEVGKVEVLFDFEPRTQEITYKSMAPTMYEEVYSLF